MRPRHFAAVGTLTHVVRPRGLLMAKRGTPTWDAMMARVGREEVNPRGELVLIDGVIDPTEEPMANGKMRIYRPEVQP